MSSYNNIDGEPVVCSDHYLREIAKERIGLRGVIRGDWGAISRIKHAHHLTSSDKEAVCLAITGGTDVKGLDYPCDFFEKTIMELVREKKLPMECVNDVVRRVLTLKLNHRLHSVAILAKESSVIAICACKCINLGFCKSISLVFPCEHATKSQESLDSGVSSSNTMQSVI